ncbi:TPA: hypothetical protein ACH3X3_007173 [Trebouxia sp. C0006]
MPLRQYNAHYLPWKPSEKQVNGCVYLNKFQSSRVGAHRHESDHFPLELQLLLTVPTLPTAPPPPPVPTPTWVWDSSQRGPYAHALLPGPCQALIAGCTAAASAHQHSLSATGSAHLELADAQFRSAIDTAAQAASLRRKQPGGASAPPPVMLPLVEPQVPYATVATATSQASLAP